MSEIPSVGQTPVAWTRDLCKRFNTVQALDHATLSIPPGCSGLLGSNGAGKSTLVRLLLGLLRPDGGSAVSRRVCASGSR